MSEQGPRQMIEDFASDMEREIGEMEDTIKRFQDLRDRKDAEIDRLKAQLETARRTLQAIAEKKQAAPLMLARERREKAEAALEMLSQAKTLDIGNRRR